MPRFPGSSSTKASPIQTSATGDPRTPRDIPHDESIRLAGDDIGAQGAAARQNASHQNALHRSAYSDERFWRKMTRFGKRAGREVALKALQLFFVLKRPDVPLWAKSTIIGALGYFISPLDAIPDFIAGVGYTDDASVLAAALVAVSIYIDEDIKRQAESTLTRWWPAIGETESLD